MFWKVFLPLAFVFNVAPALGSSNTSKLCANGTMRYFEDEKSTDKCVSQEQCNKLGGSILTPQFPGAASQCVKSNKSAMKLPEKKKTQN